MDPYSDRLEPTQSRQSSIYELSSDNPIHGIFTPYYQFQSVEYGGWYCCPSQAHSGLVLQCASYNGGCVANKCSICFNLSPYEGMPD